MPPLPVCALSGCSPWTGARYTYCPAALLYTGSMSGAAIAIVCPPARTFPFTAAVTSKHEFVSGCFVHADVEVCSIFCAVQSSAISVVAIFLFASKCPRSPMVTGVRARGRSLRWYGACAQSGTARRVSV